MDFHRPIISIKNANFSGMKAGPTRNSCLQTFTSRPRNYEISGFIYASRPTVHG